MDFTFVWGIVILTTICIEVATAGNLVCIWFALGGFVALFANILGASIAIQCVLFLFASIISLLCVRPFANKYIATKNIPTNADQLIGSKQIVAKKIAPTEWGKIRVNDHEWSAVSDDKSEIEEGTTVEVVAIEGVKLVVRKVQ